MNTLCFLNLSLLILSDLISVTGAEISQSACDSYNDWGSAGSTKLLGSKIHFMTLNQIAMHDRVICTCTPESYIHARSIVWGHTYMPSRAIHTCTPESYLHALWSLDSGVIYTCNPGPYLHALWGHTYMPSGVWGHMYMPSSSIRTCTPESYIHAIRGDTYMPSEVIHTYPLESGPRVPPKLLVRQISLRCIHHFGILEKWEQPVQLKSIVFHRVQHFTFQNIL